MHRSKQRPFRFVDLFAGAGGLSLGFEMAGFKSVFAVEHDVPAAETYRRNFGDHVFAGDICDVKDFSVHCPDVIIGGPPCQGFSPLGKMSVKGFRRGEHCTMNGLWSEFLRSVRQAKPKAFVVENVPEFLRSAEFENFKAKAKELGYNVEHTVLHAVDFGIPQKRRRGIAIGIKGGTPLLPEPTGEFKTVRDEIGDLPLRPTGGDMHWGRNPRPISIMRYKTVPPGGNRFDLMRKRPDLCPACWLNKPTGSTDVFGRLHWDKPALTIRTEFFKPEKGCYLHPKAHRPITHREAARLQTFPDNFIFHGSKIEIARQIGNAVPPRLAFHIATALRKSLDRLSRPKSRRRRSRSMRELAEATV